MAEKSVLSLAPKRLAGSTPAARSFFRMLCTASMVPAFSRCHSSSRSHTEDGGRALCRICIWVCIHEGAVEPGPSGGVG